MPRYVSGSSSPLPPSVWRETNCAIVPWGHQGHTALVSPSHKFASHQNLCLFLKHWHISLWIFSVHFRPFSHATAPYENWLFRGEKQLGPPNQPPGNARNGLLGGNCTKRAIPKLGPWEAFRGQWCWLMKIWWYDWWCQWWGWNEIITNPNGNFLLLFVTP